MARRGGPDRVRTDDLLDANQALSQLSYGPLARPSTYPNIPGTLGAALKAGQITESCDSTNGNVDHSADP